ncbi:MAG: hypothetical protein H0U42_06165 [Thermoleophilaceae bacterium]|nr:hypothetical protein [Thermoleophilaceae bacterium]
MKHLPIALVLAVLVAPTSSLAFSERFEGKGDDKIDVRFQLKDDEVRGFTTKNVEFTCSEAGDTIVSDPKRFKPIDVRDNGRFDDRFSNRFRDRDSDAKVKLTSEVDGRLTDEEPVKERDGVASQDEEVFQKGRGELEFTLEFETGDRCESGELDWKAKAR